LCSFGAFFRFWYQDQEKSGNPEMKGSKEKSLGAKKLFPSFIVN
jgi:hypothetical protein